MGVSLLKRRCDLVLLRLALRCSCLQWLLDVLSMAPGRSFFSIESVGAHMLVVEATANKMPYVTSR